MDKEEQVIVRPRQREDSHADFIARGQWLAKMSHKHLHWPAAGVDEESDNGLVVEMQGKVVGRMHIDAVYPPFGELQNMNVARPFRGRGAGGALVDECLRQLGRLGFMAVFLQTHFDNPPAHRLYARKGFFPVARGEMLRLLRFISLPLWEEFMHDHPLAVYRPPEGTGLRRWPMTWSDRISGDALGITLTGGSSDKDSDEYGPGLAGLEIQSKGMSFSASLTGPATAAKGQTITLPLKLANCADAPLRASAHLLLPPGFKACGQWKSRGAAESIDPGQNLAPEFEITVPTDIDLTWLERHATFPSLPLTVEVFVGSTSFWLTHQVMVEKPG